MRFFSGSGDDTKVYGIEVPQVIKGSGETYVVSSKIAKFLISKRAALKSPDFASVYCSYSPLKGMPMTGGIPETVDLKKWFKNIVIITKANNNFYPLVYSNDLETIEKWLMTRKVPIKHATYRPDWESLKTVEIANLTEAANIEFDKFEKLGFLYECYLELLFADYRTVIEHQVTAPTNRGQIKIFDLYGRTTDLITAAKYKDEDYQSYTLYPPNINQQPWNNAPWSMFVKVGNNTYGFIPETWNEHGPVMTASDKFHLSGAVVKFKPSGGALIGGTHEYECVFEGNPDKILANFEQDVIKIYTAGEAESIIEARHLEYLKKKHS